MTRALVLRTGHFREIDIWLKLLLPGSGIQTAFAFGGAKSKHRFPGCLDVLNTLNCRLRTSGRGQFLTLEEACLLEGPVTLRSNWSRMGLAANCLRFLEVLDVSADNAEAAFALVEALRSTLESRASVSQLFPLFFRFALACRVGYAPDLVRCGLCGRSLGQTLAFFQVSEGLMLCAGCRHSPETVRQQLPVSWPVRRLLLAVQKDEPRDWQDLANVEDRRACSTLIDGFIQYHLGIVWDRGGFRKL
ncbi:MAG: DNA repair protein RecO C-terminal domain-containing protein [Desulfovibrio sp.]|nr:DNA repair protein RecO C-terminal domain-containing protein [Desulfovibrio sp.]